MTEHTKEPWEVVAMRGLAVCVVQEADHGVLISIDGQENSLNDMKRIVACVNALAGVEDPEAFMRDVREFAALNVGDSNAKWTRIRNKVREHLKGGDE